MKSFKVESDTTLENLPRDIILQIADELDDVSKVCSSTILTFAGQSISDGIRDMSQKYEHLLSQSN
jgi:ABC-type polysaccharide/polyol phosphate transport system ATPase subunit